MRYVLLTLVLLVLGWFGYGFLAGGEKSRAAGAEEIPPAGEVLSTRPLSPSQEGKSAPPEGPAGGIDRREDAGKAEKGGDHPGSPSAARAGEEGLLPLKKALQEGDLKAAWRIVKDLAPRRAGDPRFRALALQGARKALDQGALERSARILTAVIDAWTRGPLEEKDLPEFQEAQALLRRVMDELLFNPGGAWRSRTYVVKRGDALERIARHFSRAEGKRVTAGFLEAVNRVPAGRIRVGQKLRIPIGRLHVVVEKKSYVLKLFLDDILVRVYRVGLGKDGKTPSARFTVLLKQKNPVWWHPTRGPIPHGHPDNPLGDYFIKLASDRYTGFGIHGTKKTELDSIGKNESQGCVRMYPQDVKELFSFLPKGAEVLIR